MQENAVMHIRRMFMSKTLWHPIGVNRRWAGVLSVMAIFQQSAGVLVLAFLELKEITRIVLN
jgi:hypothetical protein